jgi:hypothetical protein
LHVAADWRYQLVSQRIPHGRRRMSAEPWPCWTWSQKKSSPEHWIWIPSCPSF